MAWASSLMMYQEVPIREEWEKRIDQDISQKVGGWLEEYVAHTTYQMMVPGECAHAL